MSWKLISLSELTVWKSLESSLQDPGKPCCPTVSHCDLRCPRTHFMDLLLLCNQQRQNNDYTSICAYLPILILVHKPGYSFLAAVKRFSTKGDELISGKAEPVTFYSFLR